MDLLTKSADMLACLDTMGIHDSMDLVSYLPYRYESFAYSDESRDFKDRERVVILGRLVSNPKMVRAPHLTIVSFNFVSRNSKLYKVKAYNRQFLMKTLNLADEFSLSLTYNEARREFSLVNFRKGEIPKEEQLKAVYHLPGDLASWNFSNLLKRTFDRYMDLIPEVLPSYLRTKYKLLKHEEALRKVHFPKNNEEALSGLRTLKFEEAMDYCLRNRLVRDENKKMVKSVTTPIDTSKINDFVRNLPYKLSSDQTQAVREIILDMKKESLMYRLLQGDVGTGKTLVAVIALYGNYLRHNQGVLLAPTDSLARQHYDNACAMLEPYGIHVGLMVGSLASKERKELLEKIASGEMDVIIGTHAVFSKDVEYASLGLAVIDEQHRFGVNQRNCIVGKGENVDLLLMSATPIPRTLALSIYGNLDVSSLSVFPSGKREVVTRVVDDDDPKIAGLIQYALDNHKQVFMVCPKISVGKNQETDSAEEIYKKYKSVFTEKIGLLHGKLKNEEKLELLDQFRKGIIPILVCTTVVELGIDVKSAIAMIIFSADSFGLASLHQLRGRVGRDGSKAYCLLVQHFEEEDDPSRLKFLEKCSDGFEISEEDMKRRGPGDFAGIEQSGFPSFACLNIVSDFKMFEVARNEAAYLVAHTVDKEIGEYVSRIASGMKEKESQITLFD